MSIDRRPDPHVSLPWACAGWLHSEFLKQVQERPGAAAIVSDFGSLTYSDLELRTRRLAHWLLSMRASVRTRLAIYASRSTETVVAMLAASRAGIAFSVIDEAYPDSRVSDIVDMLGPDLIIVSTSQQEWPFGAEVTRIPQDTRTFDALFADAGPLPEPEAMDIDAYVFFTSGSTGRPKGIVTGHAPVPHFIRWHVAQHGLGRGDRFSMLSGLGHDPVLRDIFTPLSIGATLYIPRQDVLVDPSQLGPWIRAAGISVLHLTPALGQVLVEAPELTGTLETPRIFCWGSEPLTRALVRRIGAVAPGAQHVNFYGATETPQAVAAYAVGGGELAPVYPIGRGIDDTQLLVVRDDGAMAGEGEVGEIWVRTPYLASGYLGPVEQTREKFVVNPFTEDPSDLCYRTGDLGRYDRNFDVEYLGRGDQQLKIRGFRVEPAEIVSRAEAVAGVSRALVRKVTDSEGSASLHLFIAGPETGPNVGNEVMATIRRELPGYMWPARVHAIEQMPLLANGKVDVLRLDALAALPAPVGALGPAGGAGATPAAGARAAMTAEEERIAAVWREILQVDTIGPDDRFSDLGGDSLGAVRALVRMKRLGIPEELCRGILQGKSVREIARGQTGVAIGAGSVPAPRTGHETTTLQINMARGVMILLLVADHWMEGFLNRLPGGLTSLRAWLTPIFNIATPGFAFMFGLSIGYLYFHLYPQRLGQIWRSLRFGALLLSIGILIRAASVLALTPLAAIDASTIGDSLFSALLFYLLAVLSVPLWFAFVRRFEHPEVGAVALASMLLLLHQLAPLYWGATEPVGLVQLLHLMTTAKFSYFNMGFGAALGLLAGILMRGTPSRFGATALFPWAMSALALGLALALAAPGGLGVFMDSNDMGVWRWCSYIGATLLLLVGTGWLASRLASLKRGPAGILQLVSVIGQCSLPIFVLHGLVLKVKQLLVLGGVPGSLALALPLMLFLAAMTWMIRNLYRLSYAQASP